MISSGEDLDAFFTSIVEAQSTNVDGISGATTESAAIKDAITLAIMSGAIAGRSKAPKQNRNFRYGDSSQVTSSIAWFASPCSKS